MAAILIAVCGLLATELATACVYLTRDDGARYALAYASEECRREGYAALPLDQYDPMAKWSSHAKYTDTLARFDEYRIRARMAPRDERSEHSDRRAHALFTRRSEYKWAEHTKDAYYAMRPAAGRASPITQSFEASLREMGLARMKDELLEVSQQKLSAAEKKGLLALLARTEAALREAKLTQRMLRSIEDFARTAPPDHRDRIRRDLGRFRLD